MGGGIEDNSKIIFLISQCNPSLELPLHICCDPSLELSGRDGLMMGHKICLFFYGEIRIIIYL